MHVLLLSFPRSPPTLRPPLRPPGPAHGEIPKEPQDQVGAGKDSNEKHVFVDFFGLFLCETTCA